MENINYPLDLVTVNDIVMQTDYVMYLDFAVAFNEMLDGGLIEKIIDDGEEKYVVTEKGRYVARELKSDLLSSILDQSLANALRYLNFKKRGIVPKCAIEKTDDGRYNVICSFMDNPITAHDKNATFAPQAAPSIPHLQTTTNNNSKKTVPKLVATFKNMLVLILPLIRKKLSSAKFMVVKGEQIAYTRIYCTPNSKSSPSAPINRIKNGEEKYNIPPNNTPVVMSIINAHVK